MVGEDWNPYIFEAAISVRPGDCCVSDCLSRDDDIYIYVMICNSWAVGPQLLGSEFIHLEAIVFSCTVATVIRCLGLAFGGFLIDQI